MKLGLRRAAQIVRAVLVRLLQTTWWKPMVRVALLACGLLVLAFIGRATSPASASPAAPSSSPSASAIPVAPALPSTPTPTPLATTSAGPAQANAPSSAVSARATPETPVILNVASIDDLRRLPGIGPKRAEAVLALRAKIGRFHQVEDLLRVKGIGRATLKRLRPLVRLDPVPPSGGDQAAAR